MVFTVGPAPRVPEQSVCIRLEDVIVIGERKAEILATFVPIKMRSVELLMREEGMPQRCARGGGR
jgi:hypothetical protein